MSAEQILALLLHVHYFLEVAGVTNTLLPAPGEPLGMCVGFSFLAALISFQERDLLTEMG